MSKLIDMKGQRFGRLRVISHSHKSTTSGSAMWNCKCDCGKKTTVPRGNLINGLTKSCGCLRAEITSKRTTTHGLSRNRVHRAWRRIQKHPVCAAWRTFSQFLEDIGDPPTPKHILVISDTSLEYSPQNCRWALRGELVKRKIVHFQGRAGTIAEWAKEANISANCLNLRLKRGWSFKEALTLPVRGKGEPVDYRV